MNLDAEEIPLKEHMMSRLHELLMHTLSLLARPMHSNGERGDVPGWVMVVVMTAALVIAILIPFREAIVAAVQNAITSVTGT